jgi:UDP-N-acetylglucosamine 2-epimerase (non-hydrolysing)
MNFENQKNPIHFFSGTEAEIIKIAPVMQELTKRKIEYNFIWSGQHKQKIDKHLKNFNIKKPDIVLHKGAEITKVSQMFFWLVKLLIKNFYFRKKAFKGKKGIVLLHGDTMTTVIGSIWSRLNFMKVGHLEAGLTSNKLFRPLPEEIDRLIVSKFSNYYFCPNEWAIENLNKKKRKGIKINTNQNTLFDSINQFLKTKNKRKTHIPKTKYAVCSLHRFENVYNEKIFIQLVKHLEEISKHTKILFILHKNTNELLIKFNLKKRLEKNKNIELRQRYGYFDFISLVQNSEFFISDGGSNQEESSYLGIPTIILRSETERIEGLGKNVIITNFNIYIIKEFLKNYKNYKYPILKLKENPSKIIVDYLLKEGFGK